MDYSKSKIYKITDKGYNECYYGSTIQPLSKRIGKHRSDYKRYKEGKQNNSLTSFILFDKYGLENCKIELVEEVECKTKEELHQREGFYIKNNECVNKVIAGRTWKEYYKDNRHCLIQKTINWNSLHKNYTKENNKKWRENNTEYDIQRKKDWGNDLVMCDICKREYKRNIITKHNKTNKHQNLLKTNNIME